LFHRFDERRKSRNLLFLTLSRHRSGIGHTSVGSPSIQRTVWFATGHMSDSRNRLRSGGHAVGRKIRRSFCACNR
jgi:hypothetical protein